MEERQERIGLNEALFREVNERVRSINEGFGSTPDDAQFVCECGLGDCTERIRMPLGDYERLRSEATHFAVRPGHQLPEAETVVADCGDYLVVEKHAGAAALLAKKTDPRR